MTKDEEEGENFCLRQRMNCGLKKEEYEPQDAGEVFL